MLQVLHEHISDDLSMQLCENLVQQQLLNEIMMKSLSWKQGQHNDDFSIELPK